MKDNKTRPENFFIFVVLFFLSVNVMAGYECWKCNQTFEIGDSEEVCQHETLETHDFLQNNPGCLKSTRQDDEFRQMDSIPFYDTLQGEAFTGSKYAVIPFDREKMLGMIKQYEPSTKIDSARLATYIHGGVAAHMIHRKLDRGWTLTDEVYQHAQHFSAKSAGRAGMQNVSDILGYKEIFERFENSMEEENVVSLTGTLHQYQDILEKGCNNENILMHQLDFKPTAAPAPILLTVVRYGNNYAICASSGLITFNSRICMTRDQVIQCMRWIHHFYSPHLKPATEAGRSKYRADVFTSYHSPAWANRSVPARYVAAGAVLAVGVGVAGWYFLKK